jgi:hypothetical protein
MATAAGPRPAGLDAYDLPDVAAAFEQPAPFVTVYCNTEPDVEDARHRAEVHWRDTRKELDQAGAPPAALNAIEATIAELRAHAAAVAAIANRRGIVVQRGLDEPVRRDLGRVAPLPSVGPIIEEVQRQPAHVVVLLDRVGGDIIVFDRAEEGRVITVDGDRPDDPVIRRSKPGGWSQRRYQQRAMNRWKADAEEVAATVSRLASQVNARVVIIAGDPQALHYFRESLPDGFMIDIREVDGSRAAGADTDEMADAVVRTVATAVAEDTVQALEKFREERGQHDRACEGAAATLTALAAAQVDLLLVHDDPDDNRLAWFGPQPNMVGTDAETVRAMGVDEPVEARLVDVALRAALGTGAAVRIVPAAGGPAERIGGILRFANP